MRPAMRINRLPACFLTMCLNSAGPRTVFMFPTLIYSKDNNLVFVRKSLFKKYINVQNTKYQNNLKRPFIYVQLWSIQLSLQTNYDC